MATAGTAMECAMATATAVTAAQQCDGGGGDSGNLVVAATWRQRGWQQPYNIQTEITEGGERALATTMRTTRMVSAVVGVTTTATADDVVGGMATTG